MFGKTAEQARRHNMQGSKRAVHAEPQVRTLVIGSLLFVVAMMFLATASFAQISIGIRVGIAPPPLPYYEQPICPGDGYIWTPGYWDWDGAEYYWVPGTWVMAPEIGDLWTPGYWGWDGYGYVFNEGYWGPSVGFYGGINYGFGYFGHGYEGGRWQNGHFFYNTSINNVDVHRFRNVYNTRVNEGAMNRVSYNGGNGGINARASAQEAAFARGTHLGPVSAQTQHAWAARNSAQQKFSANRGTPAVAATPRPRIASHPNELPPIERPAVPKTGNAKLDQQYQMQQEQLVTRQSQERQKLQQQQEMEQQRLAKQGANATKMQQLQQRHQQQTQQLHQQHAQQTKQLQQKQKPARGGGH